MNDATKTLLLKLRKTATAAFGTKEWAIVLPEVGFGFEVTGKEGRKVTQVKITSPLGQELVINKEPNYKAIHYYGLSRWLKEIGVDLVESASVRLGMDTPAREAELKKLYTRDLTNTGTCPVCGGNFKRNSDGGLVHHGYKRPGDGYIYGDCFAVNYQPWELSPVGAQHYVAQVLKPFLADRQQWLTKLQAGEVTKFLKEVKTGPIGNRKVSVVEVTKESDEYEFDRMLESAVYAASKNIAWATKEIEIFEARIAAWKSDDLPEVKYKKA